MVIVSGYYSTDFKFMTRIWHCVFMVALLLPFCLNLWRNLKLLLVAILWWQFWSQSRFKWRDSFGISYWMEVKVSRKWNFLRLFCAHGEWWGSWTKRLSVKLPCFIHMCFFLFGYKISFRHNRYKLFNIHSTELVGLSRDSNVSLESVRQPNWLYNRVR